MPYRGNVYESGWDQVGSDLGKLLATLLFKNQLAAQRDLPAALKANEEAQIRGDYGTGPSSLPEMGKKNPRLAKLFERQGVGPFPKLAPETIPEGQQGPPRMVPPKEVPYPTKGPEYAMRLEQDKIAGRAVPGHVKQDENLLKYQVLALIQQRNPALALRVASENELVLDNVPDSGEMDPQLNARANTALRIMDDYIDSKGPEGLTLWQSLEPYIYQAAALPNLAQFVRRPKDYAPGTGGPPPNATIEAFTNMYKEPILALHPGDPVTGMQDFLGRMKTFVDSGRITVPTDVVPKTLKPMTMGNAMPTARDMAHLMGGNLADYAEGIASDNLPDKVWQDYYLRIARVDDEKRFLGLARANIANKRLSNARENIKKIYEGRGMTVPEKWIDKVIKRIKGLDASLPIGAYERYTDPLDILTEEELSTPEVERPQLKKKSDAGNLANTYLPPVK